MTPDARRLIASLVTLRSNRFTQRDALVTELAQRGQITLRIAQALCDAGLTALLPSDWRSQVSAPLAIASVLPLADIFSYLPSDTPACLHSYSSATGSAASIVLGMHAQSDDCMSVSLAQTRSAFVRGKLSQGFPIVLALDSQTALAVRRLVRMSDQSVRAQFYGSDITVTLQASPANDA